MSCFAHSSRRPTGKLFAALVLVALGALSSTVNAGDEDYAAMLRYLGRASAVQTRQQTSAGSFIGDNAASVPDGRPDGRVLSKASGSAADLRLQGDRTLASIGRYTLPGGHIRSGAETTNRVLSLSVSELPR